MRAGVLALLFVTSVVRVAAIKVDISLQDIDQALTVARSRDTDRAKFHARYIQEINTQFVERVELVTELRRVVLLAEERAARGDRQFGYSVTRVNDALSVFRRRLSVIARVRFHPQNNYVDAPPVTMVADGHDRALIGVKREAILALPPGRKGEFVPVLGAVVEGVFDAEALGQGSREFVISLEGRELARVTFDLSKVD